MVITMPKIPLWVYGLAAAGVVAYVIKKGGVSNAVAGVTAGVVSGGADVVGGVASGAVLGVGDVLGVPRVNESKCEMAKRLNNKWDASFYCSAGDYFGFLFSDIPLIGDDKGTGASGSW
jgi:hypothetical protein